MKKLNSKYLDRNFFAGVFGNILEWYDFAVFGFLTPIIGELFFPKEDKIVGILMAYGVFATGYFMRPLGGIIFGHIGDKYGRKIALQISMFAMAIPTVLMGFLPTYKDIGIWAAFLLIFLRMVQGASVGGELMGSVSYLVEIAPLKKRNFYGSFTLFSAVGGLLFGSAVVTILDMALGSQVMSTWGWRIPFIGGVLIFAFGLWLRDGMRESPDFLAQKEIPQKTPFLEILKTMPMKVFQLFCIISVATVGVYILFIWLSTYMADMIASPIQNSQLLATLSMVVVVFVLPFSGYISDIYGETKVFRLSCISLGVLIYPIFMLINLGDFWLAALGMFIFAIVIGFIQGPLPVLMTKMFPANLRYTGIGLGYNTATAILGGTTPMIATVLVKVGSSIYLPAIYLIFFSLVALFATMKKL
jgi:MHS family proline/betaine transporter-like MFS transporter